MVERFEFSQEADEAAEVSPTGPWVRYSDVEPLAKPFSQMRCPECGARHSYPLSDLAIIVDLITALESIEGSPYEPASEAAVEGLRALRNAEGARDG